MLGYDHVEPGVRSVVCGKVTTTPPQPGAQVLAQLTRPDSSTAATSATLNGSGMGTFAFDIFTFGAYGVSVAVQTPGGSSPAGGTINVTGAPGTCP
jgi:hypothetical protein